MSDIPNSENNDGKGFYVLVSRKFCYEARKSLEAYNMFDCSRRIEVHYPKDLLAIPVRDFSLDKPEFEKFNFALHNLEFPSSQKCKYGLSPKKKLVGNLKLLVMSSSTLKWDQQLENNVANKWEKHGDLVVLPQNSFTDERWMKFEENLWQVVADSLGVNRVAQRVGPILNDDFRSPRVVLRLGHDPIVEHLDIGIKYTFDITKCMFSMGNIVEKQRIAKFNCRNETVVDLYAGIGYFTLPYLVHANAGFVHACEWNPSSVSFLERNLVLNGVIDRCRIHFGDNRQICPRDVADRVNLGLLPDSNPGWEIACRALRRDTGGILHVHGNVDIKNRDNSRTEWTERVRREIREIFAKVIYAGMKWECDILCITKIKSYGPKVDHLVLDLRCTPI